MTDIVWAPQATTDVEHIYVRIARHNVNAAEAFVVNIYKKIGLLNSHPLIGVARPDLQQGLRMLTVPPYVIYYTLERALNKPGEDVRLLRILDGRRDLADLL